MKEKTARKNIHRFFEKGKEKKKHGGGERGNRQPIVFLGVRGGKREMRRKFKFNVGREEGRGEMGKKEDRDPVLRLLGYV